MTQVRVQVSGSLRGRAKTITLLVDTGASYSILPRSLLQELGVLPLRKERFELADGTPIHRDVGIAYLRYRGTPAATYVIFGGSRDSSVLGVVALEELGYQVDPVNERLRKARRLLVALRALST